MRKTPLALYCIVAAAASLIAGCGGSAVVPSHGASADGTSAIRAAVAFKLGRAIASVTVRVQIPAQAGSANRGMTIAFAGASTVTLAFDLASTTDCKTSGTSKTCTFKASVGTGSDIVTVKTYSLAPVGGKIPSNAALIYVAATPYNVAGNPTFGLTISGTVASLALSGMPKGIGGTPIAAQNLTLAAKDKSANLIVGPYANTVTLSDGDATGATKVVTNGPKSNGVSNSTDKITFSYTGLAIVPATIQAKAAGAASGSASFAPSVPPIGPSSLLHGLPTNLHSYSSIGPARFQATQTGWTNAPFNKGLTASMGSCPDAVVEKVSATTFALAVYPNPSASCTMTITGGGGATLKIPVGIVRYTYTGSSQSFTVPAGISQETILAIGAQGANAFDNNDGGSGALVAGTFALPSGTVLDVEVGQIGQVANASSSPTAYNGGGASSFAYPCGGGGGGGATDIRLGGNTYYDRILVGGGGGGAPGCFYPSKPTHGGGGGGGGAGINGQDGVTGGGGGASSAGGAGGSAGNTSGCGGGVAGTAGTLGIGGAGGAGTYQKYLGTGGPGGGGGGGYYGGGGGGSPGPICATGGGGGGGGSSYISSTAKFPVNTPGYSAGSGLVLISW